MKTNELRPSGARLPEPVCNKNLENGRFVRIARTTLRSLANGHDEPESFMRNGWYDLNRAMPRPDFHHGLETGTGIKNIQT